MVNLLLTNKLLARFVVLVCLTGITNPLLAQGEYGRRAGAELRVLAGDAGKLAGLTNSEQNTSVREGLKQRIQGAFAAIDILLRMADQESGRAAVSYHSAVQNGLDYLANEQFEKLNKLVLDLSENFPLKIPLYEPTVESQQAALALHKLQCAACHDNPVTR